MTYTCSSIGDVPTHLRSIVARSTTVLPPMVRPQDEEFLRKMYGIAESAFWMNFVGDLPPAARDAFEQALQEPTGDGLEQWFNSHANIQKDSKTRTRAQDVLAHMAEHFPSIMKEEYDLFTEDDAVAL